MPNIYLRNVQCEAIFSGIGSAKSIPTHGLSNGQLDIIDRVRKTM